MNAVGSKIMVELRSHVRSPTSDNAYQAKAKSPANETAEKFRILIKKRTNVPLNNNKDIMITGVRAQS
jgi:hypothetical protein